MKTFTVTVPGHSDDDVACGLREVARMVEEGYTNGMAGSCSFDSEGEYEEEQSFPDEDEALTLLANRP